MTDPRKPSRSNDRDKDDEARPYADVKINKPAGPHATPENIEHEATSGTGALSDGEGQDATGRQPMAGRRRPPVHSDGARIQSDKRKKGLGPLDPNPFRQLVS